MDNFFDRNGLPIKAGDVLSGKNMLGEEVQWKVTDPREWKEGYGISKDKFEQIYQTDGLYFCRDTAIQGGGPLRGQERALAKMEIIRRPVNGRRTR